MKIKKYVVNNMSEAVNQIKRELGSEALILSSRQIRQPGWKGFLGGKLWEVTAAADRPAPVTPLISPEAIAKESLHKEISEIKEILAKYPQKKQSSPITCFSRNRTLNMWAEKLTQRGISLELARQVLTDVKIDLDAEGRKKEKGVEFILNQKLEEMLNPIYINKKNGRIIVFVGPTGVGKTTTMAKLAAQFSFGEGKKVGLVTIDTYRIGAVEQLKIYGEIMGNPVGVVNTPGELSSLLDEMQDKDIILIDTAGRSYKNEMHIRELRAFLAKVHKADICLVLSATTKSSDLWKNVNIFHRLGFSRFIFTKIDETDIFGDIFNISVKSQVPVSYITNGQNVPQDIQTMEPQRLIKLVLEGADGYGPGF